MNTQRPDPRSMSANCFLLFPYIITWVFRYLLQLTWPSSFITFHVYFISDRKHRNPLFIVISSISATSNASNDFHITRSLFWMFLITLKFMASGLCSCYKILKHSRNNFRCLFLIEQHAIIHLHQLFLYCFYVNNFISYKSNCKGTKFASYRRLVHRCSQYIRKM